MILKASQRGGAKELAVHLLRTDENEHVELHEVRGFMSDDLTGALKEAQATAKGTRCTQFLFSVSLNPPEDQDVKIATFENAIDRIEEKNGLTGQPRVVIFHEKEGRRHAHAIWSRIDADTMTARNLSHFKLKLRDISRELYLENDWQMPRGLMNSKDKDPRNFTLAEWQQAKRMGHNARDLKATMQECWAVSDSKTAFAHALQERGLILAKGDRRSHVAVTHEGEVISIARYVGRKAKEITTKLGRPDDLPSVDQAKAQFAKDLRQTFRRHVDEAREQKRRALEPLEQRCQAMTRKHRDERSELAGYQKDRWQQENRQRSARLKSGMRGIWQRLSGDYTRIRKQNEQESYAALQRDRRQREALIFGQMRERRSLQAQIKTVRKLHAVIIREIRQDQQHFRQMERDTASAAQHAFRQASPDRARMHTPTTAERLERLRTQKPIQNTRGKGPERER
ncbi:MAG: relaxase [Rhodomicrobium sp.]|nr:relaxase [Rhodomicrobium sp.]